MSGGARRPIRECTVARPPAGVRLLVRTAGAAMSSGWPGRAELLVRGLLARCTFVGHVTLVLGNSRSESLFTPCSQELLSRFTDQFPGRSIPRVGSTFGLPGRRQLIHWTAPAGRRRRGWGVRVAVHRARVLSVGLAGALMAALLSTMSVVSPPLAAAAEDSIPVVPSQSLGTVPAQQAEEAGKALPTPKWPTAAEATVDLSPANPVEETPSPSPSQDEDQSAAEVGDVVEGREPLHSWPPRSS